MTLPAAVPATPILDFLREYRASGTSRLHMPGHKGNPPAVPGFDELPFALDITEIRGADALYEAEGIIGESEEIAAGLFGAASTCYSAGGSTLSILAMVRAARRFGGKILAARNCHLAFLNACTLLDWQPCWLCPPYDGESGLARTVTAADVAAAMDADPEIRSVYLTSPDYYGAAADIAAIAEEVHARGGMLLVDNAHGAHLRFLPKDRHPMTLGADLCCDSAHKTLPVLTGGGYLHSAGKVPKEQLKADMALFGSTSPSYLILASLDLCNRWLAGPAREEFARMAARTARAAASLREKGVFLHPGCSDPAKIAIDCRRCGFSHEEIAALLRKNGIEPEFCGGGKIVLMFSPCTPDADCRRLEKVFAGFSPAPPIPYPALSIRPRAAMSLREAAFSPWERVGIDAAAGRIAAETKITCPPAVPIVAAGEIIGENEKKLLKNSGIFFLKVVK